MTLFDRFSEAPPARAQQLYEGLHLSARQSQRMFARYFALSPQKVLSILRFQRALWLLRGLDGEEATEAVLAAVHYYDQSHLIRDFKKHIGLTPRAYLQSVKDGAYLQSR